MMGCTVGLSRGRLVDSLPTSWLCHRLQLIYKTLLGETPLYLSSLLLLNPGLYLRSSKLIRLTITTVRTSLSPITN